MTPRHIHCVIFWIVSLLPCFLAAQLPQAMSILRNTCQVHDPENRWTSLKGEFTIQQNEPSAQSQYIISLNQKKNSFIREEIKNGYQLIRRFENGIYHCLLDGRKVVTENEKAELGLDEQSARQLLESFMFLFGAPMQQGFDAAYLSDTPEEVSFNGKSCFRLTLRYPPFGETETWYLYVNRETYLLEGCAYFLHDPVKDGCTIFFSGFVLYDEILFPKERRWIRHADNQWIKTEVLNSVSR